MLAHSVGKAEVASHSVNKAGKPHSVWLSRAGEQYWHLLALPVFLTAGRVLQPLLWQLWG